MQTYVTVSLLSHLALFTHGLGLTSLMSQASVQSLLSFLPIMHTWQIPVRNIQIAGSGGASEFSYRARYWPTFQTCSSSSKKGVTSTSEFATVITNDIKLQKSW